MAASAACAAPARKRTPILDSKRTRKGGSNGQGRGPVAASIAETAAAAAAARRRKERRRRRWAVLAVLFPLFFLVVIGVGVAAMFYRHMEFFRPPPVGRQMRAEPRLAGSWTGPSVTPVRAPGGQLGQRT